MSPSPRDRVNFVYKLGGQPKEINVFELAPTLLALGQLIQESNRTLYPQGQEIAVNVKPFKEGSFIVDVVLFPTDGIDEILRFAQHTSGHQIVALLASIGIIAKGVEASAKAVTSVVKAIRELGGKTNKVEELKPGEFRYESDNTSITVGRDVHTLMQNPTIVNNIYKVYGKPLENEKIEDVESYLEGEESESKVQITRADAPRIREFIEENLSAQPERVRDDDSRIIKGVYLNPRRGAYRGDGKQWSFYRGKNVIVANIKDDHFLGLVESGEIRPHHLDLMTVTLSEKQKVSGTRVSVTYEILKVEDYELGGKQMELQSSLAEVPEPKALPPAPESGGE